MSGGHWGYQAYKIEEDIEAHDRVGAHAELIAAIEHTMDWALSCDTCEACARLLVWSALERHFDALYDHEYEPRPIDVLNGKTGIRCERCQANADARAAQRAASQ